MRDPNCPPLIQKALRYRRGVPTDLLDVLIFLGTNSFLERHTGKSVRPTLRRTKRQRIGTSMTTWFSIDSTPFLIGWKLCWTAPTLRANSWSSTRFDVFWEYALSTLPYCTIALCTMHRQWRILRWLSEASVEKCSQWLCRTSTDSLHKFTQSWEKGETGMKVAWKQ